MNKVQACTLVVAGLGRLFTLHMNFAVIQHLTPILEPAEVYKG